MNRVVVAAMYHFITQPHDDLLQLKEVLLHDMNSLHIRGTFLIAPEGINGTVAGSEEGITKLITTLQGFSAFRDLKVKYSYTDTNPFHRAKVKIKKEIVTMGCQDVDVVAHTAEHVPAEQWDALVNDPDCVVIDTRNDYEVQIGTFKGAVNPQTETFREFPDYMKQHYGDNKDKKIAMFCTGGIRCEKASAYMRQEGYRNVYQLSGGVLQYLEDKQGAPSAWEGDLFVFDNRVAVNQHLEKSVYSQCYACRRPITDADKQHPAYEEGVSCHHCIKESSAAAKIRFAQRQKQMALAKSRGKQHLGVNQQLLNEEA